MAKRFGRNQRRALMADVTEFRRLLDQSIAISEATLALNDSLAKETVAAKRQLAENAKTLLVLQDSPWAPAATGAEALIIPDANVREFDDTTTSDEMMMRRDARLKLHVFDLNDKIMERIGDRFRSGGDVSWRGISWRLDRLESDQDRRSIARTFTVYLTAMGKAARR